MITSCKGEGISPRKRLFACKRNDSVELGRLKCILASACPFRRRNGPYLHCLCSRGPTRDSNASAAETMIVHDAKKDQTMALRSLRRALCAEAKAKRIVHLAGFYFARSSLPS